MLQLTQKQIAWIAEMTGIDEQTITANAGAIARQGAVLDEFDEGQSRHGGQQVEIDDGPADPHFDEPGRMPELDPGPEPAQRYVKLNDVEYHAERRLAAHGQRRVDRRRLGVDGA